MLQFAFFHLLDPAADHSSDFVIEPGPMLVLLEIEMTHFHGQANTTAKNVNLNIKVLQRILLVVFLMQQYDQAQYLPEAFADVLMRHMPFDLWKITHSYMRIFDHRLTLLAHEQIVMGH